MWAPPLMRRSAVKRWLSHLRNTVLGLCFVVVQLPNHVWLLMTPWTAACQASLSPTISQSLPKFLSIASVMPPNRLILCGPLLLLPSIFPRIKVFSNESTVHIRWPKYWSFSFSISPSNNYLRLISFKFDWFNLLAVQGTPKSLLQHHSLKASILQYSAFFMVQLSHPYMTTGKTMAFTVQTSVSKVFDFFFKSLIFNTLSMFVTAFLPRVTCLLISWVFVYLWPIIWFHFPYLTCPRTLPNMHVKLFSRINSSPAYGGSWHHLLWGTLFDPFGTFLRMCSFSLAPRIGNMWPLDILFQQSLATLCGCHDF